MRKILGVAVLLALLCPAAGATDWVKIGSAPSGVTFYYDRDRANYQDGYLDVWDRIVFPSAQTTGNGAGGSVQFVELRGHHNIDCHARTVVNSDAQFYDAAGNMVFTTMLAAQPMAVTPQASTWVIAKQYCQSW